MYNFYGNRIQVTFSNRKLLAMINTNDDIVTMLRMSGKLPQVSHVQWTTALHGRRMCDWILSQQRHLHRSVSQHCCFFRKKLTVAKQNSAVAK